MCQGTAMSQRTLFGLVVACLVFSGIITAAQTTESTCPTLVEAAIETANENCTAIGRNEACYGYRSLTAYFYAAASANH